MNTGTKELKSILEELDELKLPHMAAELEELYKQPDFINTGRLELISAIVYAEYSVTMENRYLCILNTVCFLILRSFRIRNYFLLRCD